MLDSLVSFQLSGKWSARVELRSKGVNQEETSKVGYSASGARYARLGSASPRFRYVSIEEPDLRLKGGSERWWWYDVSWYKLRDGGLSQFHQLTPTSAVNEALGTLEVAKTWILESPPGMLMMMIEPFGQTK